MVFLLSWGLTYKKITTKDTETTEDLHKDIWNWSLNSL